MVLYLQFEELPLKKGPWSTEEDRLLIAYINKYGIGKWTEMPKAAGLLRSGKSCRLRWMNYLKPNLKHGNFTEEEDEIIVALHQELGNRWSVIAAELPGRTDNEIKNRWHSHLKKRLSNNFPVKQTSKPENKEKKSAGNTAPYFTILDSSSSEYTEQNLLTSDSSSSPNSISEDDETVFSPEFYQYLNQYLQDQETDYEMLIDDENRWNQSISPSGSSTSSNSTTWPNEEINVGLHDEQVPNLWEQQTFVMDEDFGSMDYMWSF